LIFLWKERGREKPDRRERSTVFEEGRVMWKEGWVKRGEKKVWALTDDRIDQVHLLESSDEIVLHVSVKWRCDGRRRKVSVNEGTNLDKRQLLKSSHRNIFFQLQIDKDGIGEKSVRGGSDLVVDYRVVGVEVEVVVTEVGEDTSESGIALREKEKVDDAWDASKLHHVSGINEGDLTLIIRFTKQILIPVGLLVLPGGLCDLHLCQHTWVKWKRTVKHFVLASTTNFSVVDHTGGGPCWSLGRRDGREHVMRKWRRHCDREKCECECELEVISIKPWFCCAKTGVRWRKDGGLGPEDVLYSSGGGFSNVSNAVANAIGSSGREHGYRWGECRTGDDAWGRWCGRGGWDGGGGTIRQEWERVGWGRKGKRYKGCE
jgi:hypothetical protein